MIYLTYAALAAIVIFVSIKCANYVDLIDKKTNLSGAFIGGVILAAVTSMPELITSITAITIVDNPGLVMGNVLGSNIFNLCILAALVLFSAKNFMKCKISNSHKITLVCTLAVYAILTVVITFKMDATIPVLNISFASILLLVIYCISLKFLASDESQNDEEDTSPLTVKQIVFRFIIMALILIVASVGITYVTDMIAAQLGLNGSVAGALFLGIATSLPELSSSVQLVRRRNFNAMVGNIVGSNMFNYLILLIGDIMYNRASIYTETAGSETNNLILFGFIASVCTGGILLSKHLKKQKKWIPITLSIGVLACYFSFLILSV